MSQQIKTTRYYNKHIRNKDIKLVRTVINKEKSFFYSILTCTISNFINFSNEKKKSFVEKFIKSFVGDFKDNVIKFYDYVDNKKIYGSSFFIEEIINKPSYRELYSMICKLIKLKGVFDLERMLKDGKDILSKTNLEHSQKEYFYKKYSNMLNSIYKYTKNDIIINDQIINEISKNLNRNIYCLDYYNEERIIFSSETQFPKTILILKIKDNYEPLGIVDENSIIRRDIYQYDDILKNILDILQEENLKSESSVSSISENQSELENSFE